MWEQAIATDAWRAAIAAARVYRRRMLRLFGIPESEIAETLRQAEREGVDLASLEITTCLRGGEIEVVTRYEPDAQATYDAFADVVGRRHADTLYSTDGTTVDDQVAALLRGEQLTPDPAPAEARGATGTRRTIAVAESCTGGLLAARLTDPPGASQYMLGGVVAYSNDVKVEQVGVPRELIERHGAVSAEVARSARRGRAREAGSGRGGRCHGDRRPGRRQRGEARRARMDCASPARGTRA